MKKLKVLCSLFGVSVLCCMGLMTDVNAAVVYDISERSRPPHKYNGVTQYFITSGTVTEGPTYNTVSYISHSWRSEGTGAYKVAHGDVITTKSQPTYILFAGESRITVNNKTDKKQLTNGLYF